MFLQCALQLLIIRAECCYVGIDIFGCFNYIFVLLFFNFVCGEEAAVGKGD